MAYDEENLNYYEKKFKLTKKDLDKFNNEKRKIFEKVKKQFDKTFKNLLEMSIEDEKINIQYLKKNWKREFIKDIVKDMPCIFNVNVYPNNKGNGCMNLQCVHNVYVDDKTIGEAVIIAKEK